MEEVDDLFLQVGKLFGIPTDVIGEDCAETATWLQLLLPASLPLKQRPALAGSHEHLSYLVVCGYYMRLVCF